MPQDIEPRNADRVDASDHALERLDSWTTACETHSWPGERRASPTVELQHVTLPRPLDGRLVLLNEPASARARSFRLLRHKLLSGANPRIIAVTSACASEGKTTCALNLALAIAEDTLMSVLLFDAHLRRPALGPILHCAPATAFHTDVTRLAVAGPPYPIVAVSGTRLHVAALPATSLEVGRLDRTLFSLVLSDLRGAYDYVVIDAASVLESGDVDVVGESSDGVVVAVRAGRSRKRDVAHAIAQLAPARILGTVLMDA
jgi:Mrp family chromosome partitioning ATPase